MDAPKSRWVRKLSLLAVALVLAQLVRYVWGQKAREASYESILLGYTTDVRLGSTRAEVEGYLRSKNIPFIESYSSGWGYDQYRVLSPSVLIYKERAFFPCSEKMTHINFEFVAPTLHDVSVGLDTDVLSKISLSTDYGGCL